MIVCDGYTERHQIDGVDVLIRPFTRHDRKSIGEYLNGMPDVLAHRAERELTLSRIVDGTDDIMDVDYERLWTLAMGVNNTLQEIADETNLSRGVYLLVRWPWMERNSCATCRAWMWMPLTGQTIRSNGDALPRTGSPLCETLASEFRYSATACPRGSWDNPIELSAKNASAYRHYQACEAAGTFPDDPIVKRNAGVIRRAIGLATADQVASRRTGGRGRTAGQLRHPART